jgi:hypothetical protein
MSKCYIHVCCMNVPSHFRIQNVSEDIIANRNTQICLIRHYRFADIWLLILSKDHMVGFEGRNGRVQT